MVTPTPTAGPLNAAITGFRLSKIRSDTSPPPSRWAAASLSSLWSKVLPPAPRSAPAQKPRPAPVTITTRIASSPSARSKTASSSSRMVAVKALRRSGRFNVTVKIPCSSSVSSVW
jgi:hypothetical protein